MTEYVGLVLFIILAAGVAAVILGFAAWLSAAPFGIGKLEKATRKVAGLGGMPPSAIKSEPFECGLTPFALPSGRMHVHFYLIAILFILFDVELVFLYPWAITCAQLGIGGFAALAVFLGILMTGFYYALKNGALDWQ